MNKNRISIIIFTILLIIASFFLFKSVLPYLLVSIVIGLIGRPIVKLLTKLKLGRFQINSGLASAITLVGFYALAIGFIALFIPAIVNEAKVISAIKPDDILAALEQPIAQINLLISDISGSEFSIQNYSKEKLTSVFDIAKFSVLLNGLTGLTGDLFISFFAISFISFFFLKDGRAISDNVESIIPTEFRNEFQSILIQVKTKMTRYFLGLVIEMIIVFALVSIGLWLFGVKNFLLIALFVSVINIIPYVGPMIGIVFGILITVSGNFELNFYTEVFPMIIKLIGVVIIVQLLDNILLQPLIYSNSVNAHPLEIFLVILIAGNIFGIKGMVLAIPIYSVLRIVINEVRNNSKFLNKLYKSE